MSAPRAKWSAVLVTALIAGEALGCARARSSPPPPEPAPEAPRGAGRSVASEGTGSVAVVDGDDLRGIPVVHVEQLLQGRVAGVQIIELPGGGISVRIRGLGSINGDTEPLYVVDGMLIQATSGRGLYWLSPGDIQRIEILKDASTTSMYGVRGANGVVLITTRRGKRTPN
ncbi:MAG: TonB-dependent receptor plug domain-containing protein [Gemmatimonadaceae bacterium]